MTIVYTILFVLLAIIFGTSEGNFSLKNVIIVIVLVSVIKFLYDNLVSLLENLDKKHNPDKKKNQMEEIKEWSKRNNC